MVKIVKINMTQDDMVQKLDSMCERATSCSKCPLDGACSSWETASYEQIVTDYTRAFPETDEAPSPADNVNHPSHYETGKFECIDVMIETQGIEAVKNFCICNAFKYLYRAKKKNGLEDYKKAKWYLEKYIELEGRQNDT